MLAEKSHKTFTTLIVAATTVAIVLYSEQAMTADLCKKAGQKAHDANQRMQLSFLPFTDRSSVQILF